MDTFRTGVDNEVLNLFYRIRRCTILILRTELG